MVKRISLLAASIGLLGSLLAPAVQAAETTTLELRREVGIMWADASVQGGSVKVVFLTPKNDNGRRQVWQSCRFSSDLAGTYQCGIDTAPGSMAAGESGRWVVKVRVDSVLEARRTFTL